MCVFVLIFLITQEMKSVCEQDKEKNKHQRKNTSTALLQMQSIWTAESSIDTTEPHTNLNFRMCEVLLNDRPVGMEFAYPPPPPPTPPGNKKKGEVTFQLSLGFLKLIQLIILLKRHHWNISNSCKEVPETTTFFY